MKKLWSDPKLLLLALLLYPSTLTSLLVVLETGSHTLAQRLAVSAVYNAVFFSVLIYVSLLVPKMIFVIIVVVTTCLMTLYTFVSVIHFAYYSQLVGLSSIHAVLDTTWSEASEFAHTALMNLGLASLIGGMLAVAPLLLLPNRFRAMPRLSPPFILRCLLTVSAFFVLLGVAAFGSTRPYLSQNNPLLMIHDSVIAVISENRETKRALESFAGNAPEDVQVTYRGAVTHILVLGESTTRRHMSLYGYRRETSPELMKLAAELEIATDACSSRQDYFGTTEGASHLCDA